jgi:uncharacterized protein
MVERDLLTFYDLTLTDVTRMKALMVKYREAPMDLGDASLVATAEALSVTRIFTLDNHFYSYMLNDRTPFNVFPNHL